MSSDGRCLVPASPKGTTVWHQGNKLVALSSCCNRPIFFKTTGWYCNECERTFAEHLQPREPNRSLSSNYIFDNDDDQRYNTLEEWVSRWTGYPVEDVTVDVVP